MKIVPTSSGHQSWWPVVALFGFFALPGCRVLQPIAIPSTTQHISAELIDQERSQVEVGRPQKILDGLGWVMGIPDKLVLWDRRVDQHSISEETILATADYMERNHLPHVKVRANQYAPVEDWKRLAKNTTVAWPWRYSLGALSVAGEAVFPGRVFGGDHFNPYTQTIHLYSDIPAIALHEAAHAKDFARRKYQGNYAAAYLLFPLWHETLATEDVFAYLDEQQNPEQIAEANRILYPAYGTYIGNAIGNFAPAYGAPIYYAAVLAGHANGRMLSRDEPSNGSGRDTEPLSIQPRDELTATVPEQATPTTSNIMTVGGATMGQTVQQASMEQSSAVQVPATDVSAP